MENDFYRVAEHDVYYQIWCLKPTGRILLRIIVGNSAG